MIHTTAIVDDSALIAEDVQIGPYSIIGANVEVGSGTVIEAHVVIKGPTVIGKNNHIHQFASIGDIPQDLKFESSAPTKLVIGDGNSIREYVSIHRAIVAEENVTRIGNNNMLMAHVHIGHNCILGNNIVIVNSSNLAGHVKVDDNAILSGFTGIHQFCKIGAFCMVGIQSKVTQDIPPFVLFAESQPKSINAIGLKRNGFSKQEIQNIRRAFKTIYRSQLSQQDLIDNLTEQAKNSEGAAKMLEFINNSDRGIAR